MLGLIDSVGPGDVKKCPLLRVNKEGGDRVVGVLPEDLRGAYIFYMAARHDLDRLHEELQARLAKVRNKIMAKSIARVMEVSQLRFDHTERNFWDEVSYELQRIIDPKYTAIRAGWKVVVFKPAISRYTCYMRLVRAIVLR
jgi:hypothetical protein